MTSILAVHPGALGDVVLFGRLLEMLRAADAGRCEITLVAGGEKARLLAGLGVVDAAVDFDALPIHEVFADAPLESCRLPELLGSHDRLVSCFAGGDRRAELRLAGLCGAATAAFLPVRPPPETQGHLLAMWCDMLGLEPPGRFAAWDVPDEWRELGGEALAASGVDPAGAYAVLHPGSGGRSKCWPVERFVELAERVGRSGLRAVFAIGPVERDIADPSALAEIAGRFATLDCPPLAVLAGALAGARAFVGNDSGVAHLAGGVGAPTVVLFGPTRPEHFAPLGPAIETVSAATMSGISVDDAREAFEKVSRRRRDN